MITLKGYENINEVLKYKGLSVFIKREDLDLTENEILDEDLIGLPVWINGEIKGYVEQVVPGNQDKLIVTNQNNKYYIPYVKGIIQKIDKEKGIILENISGLIE